MRRSRSEKILERETTMTDRFPSNSTTTTIAPATVSASNRGVKTVEEELAFPILVAERIKKSADEAEAFKPECQELGKLADKLVQGLRSVARLATSSTQSLYDRPLRRVAAECSKSLEKALALSRRCRHGGGFLRRIMTKIVGSADFRKVSTLLEASIADMTWLLSVYSTSLGTGGDVVLSLPPIASTDPILSWVWSYIAMVVHGGGSPSDRVDAINSLANHAFDNDRNKKIIIEEGGVPPLLSLLKDSTSVDAQHAAAAALINIASCKFGVSVILGELAVPTIVQVLSDSPMRLQIQLASLISTMAETDPSTQEAFAMENAIHPLVTLLSFELPIEEPKPRFAATSIHSVVQINRERENKEQRASNRRGGSIRRKPSSWSLDSHRRKEREREMESPEVKLELKLMCTKALWMLSRGNLSNSRKIAETKGLLCLAKTIEMENGLLQHNCLMALMEVCAVAESDTDLRRSAFKMNSPVAKLVMTQLLRVVQEINTPMSQIPAIRSVGYLAHTFTRKDTRVIACLVSQLGHWNPEIAAEAAIALEKFAGPGNFNQIEYCKAIIEFDGVPPLMRLVKSGHEKAQVNGLILVCYLAVNVGDSEALEHAKALTVLEVANCAPIGSNPLLRELLPKAIYHLELYHTGVNLERQSYEP